MQCMSPSCVQPQKTSRTELKLPESSLDQPLIFLSHVFTAKILLERNVELLGFFLPYRSFSSFLEISRIRGLRDRKLKPSSRVDSQSGRI